MRASHVMKNDVVFTGPDASLRLARKLMREFNIQHLPVVEHGNIVGILSEGDILLASTLRDGRIDTPDLPVTSFMSKNVITCFPTTSVSDIVATMMALQISCVPVVVDRRVIGIITTHDLMRVLVESTRYSAKSSGHQVDLQALRSA